MFFARVVLLVIVLELSGVTADAEVLETLTYRHYPVQTARYPTLLSALNAASPIREGGEIFHGYTAWNIHWNFTWRKISDGACSINTVHTDVNLTVTLPELAAGQSNFENTFVPFLEALRRHELGHYQMASEAGRQIDATILTLPLMAQCSSIEKSANEQANRILAELRRQDKQYDAQTQHGRTQGAWLPR